MTRNNLLFPLIASAAAVIVALFSCLLLLLIEEEHHELCEMLLRQSLLVLRESRERRRRDGKGDDCNRRKLYIRWDRERTRQCILDDYLGTVPKFNKDDFKRMSCISRNNYDRIRNVLCASDPFFETVMMQLEGDLFPLMPSC